MLLWSNRIIQFSIKLSHNLSVKCTKLLNQEPDFWLINVISNLAILHFFLAKPSKDTDEIEEIWLSSDSEPASSPMPVQAVAQYDSFDEDDDDTSHVASDDSSIQEVFDEVDSRLSDNALEKAQLRLPKMIDIASPNKDRVEEKNGETSEEKEKPKIDDLDAFQNDKERKEQRGQQLLEAFDDE